MRLSPIGHEDGAARLAARYDDAAPGWARQIALLGYPDAYRALSAEAVLTLARREAEEPIRVLDAGCGAGDFALAFAQTGRRPLEIDLLDLSPEMLARAAAATRGVAIQVRQILAPLADAPLAGEGYHVVLCAHLLEHIENPAAELCRLADALLPGGVLLLIANRPHWCTWLIQWRWRTRAFSPEAMECLLTDAGFRSVERRSFSAGPPARTSMGYIAKT
jgi:demethylmenaquinone methyltransferase/2-methoxy-6-polyprenyl-1,4-benzoquinol methylase